MSERGETDTEEDPPEDEPSSGADRASSGATTVAIGSGLILFALGVGVGILLTFSGHGLFAGHLSVVLTGFMVALFAVALLGIIVFVLRRQILHYLFQVTNTQLEQIAAPLASVAEHAVNRDPEGAVGAARSFAQIALARWAWLSTRRWIIASLTALIAALAALAGTALLFRQNELLAEQSVLLREQTDRLAEQNTLIDVDIQLAEAARSAALVSEIATIADRLGEATRELRQNGTEPPYDPETDLPPGLVDRIVSTSLAARPYRFLDLESATRNQRAAFWQAARRRPDIPSLQENREQDGIDDRTRLIEKAISPERGQLLAALYSSGVVGTEWFSFRGADFSFARVRIPVLALASLQFAKLDRADFSNLTIVETRFRGASLYLARFNEAIVRRSDFSAIPGDEIEWPYAKQDIPAPSQLIGADFGESAIMETSFAGAALHIGRFDRTFLADVTFAGAELAGATFREAVLLDVDFGGASLKAVDFDGALVFSEAFLDELAANAQPDTFVRDRFELAEASLEDAYEVAAAFDHIGVEVDQARVDGKPVWRVVRVKDFE